MSVPVWMEEQPEMPEETVEDVYGPVDEDDVAELVAAEIANVLPDYPVEEAL